MKVTGGFRVIVPALDVEELLDHLELQDLAVPELPMQYCTSKPSTLTIMPVVPPRWTTQLEGGNPLPTHMQVVNTHPVLGLKVSDALAISALLKSTKDAPILG